MISLPKNLEVTFLAEKKELACRGLSEVFVHHFTPQTLHFGPNIQPNGK